MKEGQAGMPSILMFLISAGLILVILGISLGIGAKVTSNVQDTMDVNSTASAAAGNATSAIGSLAEWQGTISTVVAAVVIIGILMFGFAGFLVLKRRV